MDKDDLKWLVGLLVNAAVTIAVALIARKQRPPNKKAPSPKKKRKRKRNRNRKPKR